MKALIYIFSISLSIFSCVSSPNKPKKDLFGPVKSIRTIFFDAKDSFGIVQKVRKNHDPSDILGDLLFNDNLDLYDKQGNHIESISLDMEGNVTSKAVYSYDISGKMISYTFYSDNSIYRKHIYEYDNLGKLTCCSEYSVNGDLVTKTINKYDTKGNNIESKLFNYDGSLSERTINKFDTYGNVVESNSVDSLGRKSWIYLHRYDNKGNEIYSYAKSLKDGQVLFNEFYKYDDKGNKIENKDSTGNSITTFSYEFDNHNNWIKKTIFTNSIPQSIIERKIEYYDSSNSYKQNDVDVHEKRELKDNFMTISIQDIGRIEIPITMELRDDKSFISLMADNYYKNIKNKEIKIIKPSMVIQPKGINENLPEASKVYARILFNIYKGKQGDYYKYNQVINLNSKELAEVNDMYKNKFLNDIKLVNGKLLNWSPLEVIKINGLTVFKFAYKRQLGSNIPVYVETYKFFNNCEAYDITISYRETEKALWENDLKKAVYSFTLINKK